ncbi:putative ribonuclease H-like domain-containing protein, partial [Tanacetum coccineum]
LAEEEATKTALSDEYDFIQARIEADRLLALRLQDEEREQFTIEERAKRIAKDVKETLRSDQDLLECLNTSSMKFKESKPKKHEVKQVQQSCLGEDCWELYIPDLVPLVIYLVPLVIVHNSQYEHTSSYSLHANQSSCLQLDHEVLEQVENYYFDAKEGEDSKALVTLDGEGVDWTSHSKDEQENYALMAYSSSGSNTEQSKPSESDARSSDFNSCESNCSEETHESMPEPVVNEPKVVSEPKVWSDAPIMEEYESDSEDEHESLPIKEHETPSFAFINTVKHVKTPRQTIKVQNTCSQSPKPDKKDCSSLMAEKLGLGYGFTKKACFVCGSFSHLIRDCDFHEKRRLNKLKGYYVNPIVNNARPKAGFHKTLSPFRKPFNRTTALRTNFSKQKVNTAEVNAVSAVGGKRETAVKPSAGCNWRHKRHYWNKVSKYNGGSSSRNYDYPQRALQNKGIVDSGCSRHMTGNKAYLAEYQDFNGGPVAFGGSKGYITGKGTEDNIDAGDSEIEAESAQDYFVLVIWSSYISTVKSSKAMNAGEEPNKHPDLKTDEKPVDKEDQDLLLQAGAAKASSTNIVNTASTPVSTTSPYGGLSFTDLTNTDQDDSEIPALEEIYNNHTNGIFTNASYDDEGAVADFTNLEAIVNVSPIPTSRINSIHPSTLIIGDPKSAVQTKSKHCLFACFLSQNEPKKISKALEDESWVDAMQEELLQFKIQKVWILVDLPYGKKAIGTKLVYRTYEDERGFVVVRNKARIEAIRIFLAFASYMGLIVYQMDVKGAFLYGKIDEEVYVSQPLGFVDPKYPKKMSSMGVLTFFLRLQVKQKEDGIFISQDKYVAEILKKFDFVSVKTASTPIEKQKPLSRMGSSDVDVTPKTSHLNAVKRIFRYLKGKPKLGLWYPRVSSFDLEAYSDSDYARANLDRKSTTGEVEYVAAANCYGQVLWIQNQMLDYGFNFMNIKIYIDNESTICIVKNPVFHSKTKHIAIRHHFIRDAYEKKLIQIMMESSIEVTDQGDFWNDQQDWEIVTWRLYEACGVCILEFKDGTVIHMLVERKYPLSKELLQRMLDFGLEVEVESTAALDLIRVLNSPCFMVKSWLVQDQTVLSKDYSNLLIADSLLKTIWFINAPCYGNEALASPKANGVWIAKDVKETLRSDQDLLECLNTSSMKFKESKPKKHEVKQVQQSCLGEDCWELYIPDLVPLVIY